MKILVLASTYPLGVGDTTPGFVHELCKRLVAKGHDTLVLTPHIGTSRIDDVLDGVRIHRFRYAPTRFETLVGSGGIVSRLRTRPTRLLLVPLMLGAFALTLWRAVRREHFDIIHAHWLVPQGLLVAALAPWLQDTPFICTAHGGDLFALRASPFRRFRRLVTKRAASVCVVSEYMRKVLIEEGASPDKLRVAPMGVDLSHFSPVPGRTRDSHHIIFVGRLVEKKGVTILIDAMSRLAPRHASARLSIIGDGPERPALENQVRALALEPRVRFLGAQAQSQLPNSYSSAAIAVIPSVVDSGGDQEGLGLVTIEAIGCGCAVIASDLPAIRDVVIDRETGLLAKAGDATGLAMRLDELLDDVALRERLGRDARKALERYDWRNVVEHYAEILQSAVQA